MTTAQEILELFIINEEMEAQKGESKLNVIVPGT